MEDNTKAHGGNEDPSINATWPKGSQQFTWSQKWQLELLAILLLEAMKIVILLYCRSMIFVWTAFSGHSPCGGDGGR